MKTKHIALALLVLFVLPIAVSAQTGQPNLTANQTIAKDSIVATLGNITTLISLIGVALGTAVISIGGVMFMTSSDDPAKRDQAKSILKAGIGGALLIVLAPHIMAFLI